MDKDHDTIQNIDSLEFNDTVDSIHNSPMSLDTSADQISRNHHLSTVQNLSADMGTSMNFNCQFGAGEISCSTRNFPSSGGFNVSKNSDDMQSYNSLDPFSSRGFNTKQMKTPSSQPNICLESYSNFYSNLVIPKTPTTPSYTRQNVDNLTSSSSCQNKPNTEKEPTSIVNYNHGENSTLKTCAGSSIPSDQSVVSLNLNASNPESRKTNNSQLQNSQIVDNVANHYSFGGGDMPSVCSGGFCTSGASGGFFPSLKTHNYCTSQDTPIVSDFRSKDPSISSNLQSIHTQLGTDTGEFEPHMTSIDSDIVGNSDIRQVLNPQPTRYTDHELQRDTTIAIRNLPEENNEETVTGLHHVTGLDVNRDKPEKEKINEAVSPHNAVPIDTETKQHVTIKKIADHYEYHFHNNKVTTPQPQRNGDVNQPNCAHFEKGCNDPTNVAIVPSEIKAGKDLVEDDSKPELSTRSSETKSKHDKIFKALDSVIADVNRHDRFRNHSNDSASTTKSNGKNVERVPPSTNLHCISIVLHSEKGEERKTEIKEDGEYQISAHYDALTIYDGLGEGGPVMFAALMCVAPEDISLFGVSFLNKLMTWGCRVFLPQRDLNLTGPYHENLARVIIERCNGKVIVVVSKNYANSDECMFLTYFAKQLDPAAKGRSIIPVYIDKEIPNLPNVLLGLSSIRYNEAFRKGFLRDKIVSALMTNTHGFLPTL